MFKKITLTILSLFSVGAFAQSNQSLGFSTPFRWVAYNPSGQLMYVSVDTTGALAGAGAGSNNLAQGLGYVTPVLPVAINPQGQYVYLKTDSTGALLLSGAATSVTSAAVQTALSPLTNCNISNAYVYSPFSGQCVQVAASLPNTQPATHKYLTGVNNGAFTTAQPVSSDLTDLGQPSGAAQLNNSGQLPPATLATGSPASGSYVDGSGAWLVLPKVPTTTALTAHLYFSSYSLATGAFTATQPVSADLSDLGQAGGAAQLGTNGIVQTAQPSIQCVSPAVVGNIGANLAITCVTPPNGGSSGTTSNVSTASSTVPSGSYNFMQVLKPATNTPATTVTTTLPAASGFTSCTSTTSTQCPTITVVDGNGNCLGATCTVTTSDGTPIVRFPTGLTFTAAYENVTFTLDPTPEWIVK